MRSYNRLVWGRGCYPPFKHLPLSSMMIQSLEKCERKSVIMSFASLLKCGVFTGGGLQNNDQLVKGSGNARGGGMGQSSINTLVSLGT